VLPVWALFRAASAASEDFLMATRRMARAGAGFSSDPDGLINHCARRLFELLKPVFTENHQNQRKLPNGRSGV
jgi:hypothetical protein